MGVFHALCQKVKLLQLPWSRGDHRARRSRRDSLPEPTLSSGRTVIPLTELAQDLPLFPAFAGYQVPGQGSVSVIKFVCVCVCDVCLQMASTIVFEVFYNLVCSNWKCCSSMSRSCWSYCYSAWRPSEPAGSYTSYRNGQFSQPLNKYSPITAIRAPSLLSMCNFSILCNHSTWGNLFCYLPISTVQSWGPFSSHT